MPKVSKKRDMDYITERKSDRGRHSYEICIRKNGETFRKCIKVSDFDTPKQALNFARQLRNETLLKMERGYTVSKGKTVSELYQKTFEVLEPVRVKTKMKHDIFYKYAIAPYGDKCITEVTSGDVQTSLNKYAETHTKVQTIQLLAVWRRIFRVCAFMNIDVIDRTAIVKVPQGIQGKPRKKSISPTDLETFCDALLSYNEASVSGCYYSHAVYYAIQIMRYAGLRPAETFALTREDIDLVHGFIYINKAVRSTVNDVQQISNTKTEKSVRAVPIAEELKPILRECLDWSKYDYILADYRGDLLDIDQVDTLILNCRRKIGIDFTLYQLRHQFSTDLHNSNVPPNTIRDLMGHRSASMSLDYAVSEEKDRINAVNERRFS